MKINLRPPVWAAPCTCRNKCDKMTKVKRMYRLEVSKLPVTSETLIPPYQVDGRWAGAVAGGSARGAEHCGPTGAGRGFLLLLDLLQHPPTTCRLRGSRQLTLTVGKDTLKSNRGDKIQCLRFPHSLPILHVIKLYNY